MPVVIPEGYAHCIHPVSDNASGKRFTVTYGIFVGAGGNPDPIATAVDDAWRAGYPSSSLDSNFTLQPAQIYYRVPAGLLFGESTNLALPGITARSSPPPQVAVVIRKRTAFVGRAQRGRYFLPFPYIGEGDITEQGTISSGVVAVIQARADNHFTALEASPEFAGGMQLLHSNPVNTPDNVINVLVQTIVRTQRRRLPRG